MTTKEKIDYFLKNPKNTKDFNKILQKNGYVIQKSQNPTNYFILNDDSATYPIQVYYDEIKIYLLDFSILFTFYHRGTGSGQIEMPYDNLKL